MKNIIKPTIITALALMILPTITKPSLAQLQTTCTDAQNNCRAHQNKPHVTAEESRACFNACDDCNKKCAHPGVKLLCGNIHSNCNPLQFK